MDAPGHLCEDVLRTFARHDVILIRSFRGDALASNPESRDSPGVRFFAPRNDRKNLQLPEQRIAAGNLDLAGRRLLVDLLDHAVAFGADLKTAMRRLGAGAWAPAIRPVLVLAWGPLIFTLATHSGALGWFFSLIGLIGMNGGWAVQSPPSIMSRIRLTTFGSRAFRFSPFLNCSSQYGRNTSTM